MMWVSFIMLIITCISMGFYIAIAEKPYIFYYGVLVLLNTIVMTGIMFDYSKLKGNTMKIRNYVAKHGAINRASVHQDKKHLSKQALRKQKHKKGYQDQTSDSLFCFL